MRRAVLAFAVACILFATFWPFARPFVERALAP